MKILNFVDGDVKPTIGHTYDTIKKTNEQTKSNFGYVKTRYEVPSTSLKNLTPAASFCSNIPTKS